MSRAAIEAVRSEEPGWPEGEHVITWWKARKHWKKDLRKAWMEYSLVPRKVRVVVYHGPSGSGKSHLLHLKEDGTSREDVFIKHSDTQWKRYEGERILAFDDFKHMRISLGMLDTYIAGKIPRSARRGAWDEVCICCKLHPREWWSGKYKNDPNYMARFDEVVELLPRN